MAITPLYTLAELEAEIAQAKQDLAAARKALQSHFEGGGNIRRLQREQVSSLQKHLEWLQQQRAALQTTPGAQSLIGRPAR